MRALYAKVGEEECRKVYCKDYLRSSSEANINVTVHVKDTQARSLYDNLISFEELFDMNKWSVNLGEYVDILQGFFDVFRMENFLILNYDYLLKKNTLALSNIADFLNIPDVWKKKYRMIVKNELRNYSDKLKLEDIDCRIVEKIDEYYSSYNTRLYQILNNKSKLFSSQMPNFGQFEKLPKCSKTEYFDCPHWPRLLILGTQKAATTSLFDALTKSNICEAHYDDDEPSYFGKEVHFFDEPERFEKGPSFYCSRFSMCRSRWNNITQIDLHIPTDATPNYLNFGIASQMKETFPPSAIEKIKIIVVLR